MKNLKGFNGLAFFLLMITVRANASGSYTMIVALDGSGDYTSIQSAIDASKSFPSTTTLTGSTGEGTALFSPTPCWLKGMIFMLKTLQ